MKKVGLIPNLKKDSDLRLTKTIIDWIGANGLTPMISETVGVRINRLDIAVEMHDLFKTSDFLVVLGGDGTLLNVSRNAAIYDVPVLGINLGTLGFLIDSDEADAFHSLKCVLDGKYTIQKRMMLKASIPTQSIDSSTFVALNDIFITRGMLSRLVEILVYVNDEFYDAFLGDGLVICTPTGSTAYNLSAGGPLLQPMSQIMAITPICPHNLRARSLVVSANDVVKIKLGKNNSDIHLNMDGHTHMQLNPDDEVVITKSEYHTSIIKTSDMSFFDVLRKKIVEFKE